MWCGVVWCGMDVVWCGMVVQCGLVWFGVVWCGTVWCKCGVIWCGVVWHDWHGVTWYCVVCLALSGVDRMVCCTLIYALCLRMKKLRNVRCTNQWNNPFLSCFLLAHHGIGLPCTCLAICKNADVVPKGRQ